MFCMQGKYTPMKVPIWGTCGWRYRDTQDNRLKLTGQTIEDGEEGEEEVGGWGLRGGDEEEGQFPVEPQTVTLIWP